MAKPPALVRWTDAAPICEHIRKLEERLLEPDVRASAAELEDLISSDFVEFGSSGRIYDKPAIVLALTSDPTLPGPPTVIDFRAIALGGDVVLATYRLGSSLRSSIWRCEQGSWRILFHQGTPTTQ
jgi:hypothetical protein